jgi:transposase InsO family protein
MLFTVFWNYQTRLWKVTQWAERFRVSRLTIYAVLKRARLQEFTPPNSTNHRFKTVQYGLKRLAKVEQAIQERLKRAAKRYNKSSPGELVHFDTQRLPLLKGQSASAPRDYLLVAIDDFSRELHAEILPDKTQHSAARFFTETVIAQCPYQIDYAYSDKGKEDKGTRQHAFVKACLQHGIGQKFTRIKRPQTNGKGEQVIRTLMEMWHSRTCFQDSADRRIQLIRFINFYNTVKPHKSLNNATPYEILTAYFNQPLCKQP